VTWSDGTAITAKDFVWSWQRLVDPKTVSPYASYPGNMHIENAADIALGKKRPRHWVLRRWMIIPWRFA
jgi:oligopeptide transport system substrate-binding protein